MCDNKELLALLDEQNIPFARISPFIQTHPSPYVMSDDETAACEITKYLISLGHTNIGFITGHPDFGASNKRYQGYQKALNEMGLALDENMVKQGLFTFESGEACARELLNQPNRPSAIFASNDAMAAAVLKVSAQMKINIPAELSVVGYDNAPISQQIWPSITTIKQPVFHMAESVVEKLIRLIGKKPFDDIESKFDCELITRNSTSPCA